MSAMISVLTAQLKDKECLVPKKAYCLNYFVRMSVTKKMASNSEMICKKIKSNNFLQLKRNL